MAGGISLHAVDVASGQPANGMRVELVALEPQERLVASGRLGHHGALDHPVVRGEGVTTGAYEARFHVGDWLRQRQLAEGPVFMEVAVFRFNLLDLDAHVHLPVKFTAWGLAVFRGS